MKVRLSDTASFENQADERLRERLGQRRLNFGQKSQRDSPLYKLLGAEEIGFLIG